MLVEFVKHMQRDTATFGWTPLINPTLGMDLWKYRNFGERYYVDALVGIPQDRVTA